MVNLKRRNCIQLVFFMGLMMSCSPEPTVTNIQAGKYLPTLTFDGVDYFDGGEKVFPIKFDFNTSQDANGSGATDVEDNLENYVPYAIGAAVSGIGGTNLPNRGPNDQRPSVYFHADKQGDYIVYEYWYYYADNDWLNDHEHDWEKVFVYELDGDPKFIKISTHDAFTTYNWNDCSVTNGHPVLGVDGGSHAFKTRAEDGVEIQYSGSITVNNGVLDQWSSMNISWNIYSNDPTVIGATSHTLTPLEFFYGDPKYPFNGQELGDARLAPWLRIEWLNPPNP